MKITTTYHNHFSNNFHKVGKNNTSKEKWPAQEEQTIDQHLTIGSKAKNPSRDENIS